MRGRRLAGNCSMGVVFCGERTRREQSDERSSRHECVCLVYGAGADVLRRQRQRDSSFENARRMQRNARFFISSHGTLPHPRVIAYRRCALRIEHRNYVAGTLALAGESRLGGGTLMFAILAPAGDVGATPAPSVTGEVSALTNVSTGILTGTIFPLASLILLMLYAKSIKAKNSAPHIER